MTFLELQSMVLGDRFAESKRADAKLWLNNRLGEILAVEGWTFLADQDTVSLNSASVAMPPNAGLVTGLFMADDGSPLDFVSLQDFQQRYLGLNQTGRPETFTVLGSNLLIGPTPDTAYSAVLTHDADAALLAGDSDVPVTPAWTHPALAAGAAASMLLLENDPTWQPLEQQFERTTDAMRRRYLTTGRGKIRQAPRDSLATL